MKCVGLLLLLLFNLGILCYGYNSNRILNGFPASVDTFKNVVRIHPLVLMMPYENPMNASLFINICTGTIISNRHILTAAHCAYFANITNPYYIYVLDYLPLAKSAMVFRNFNFSDHGFTTTAYPHKNFHFQHFQDDIAILEFPNGTKLGEPVKLAKNYEEGDSDIGINVGYGDTSLDPDVMKDAEALMQINQPIWPKKDCKAFDKDHPVICAGNATHRSDSGDSGGPFFINTDSGELYQIGITHAGAYKNGSGVPSERDPDLTTFLRVSAYCDWIEKTTGNEAKCVDIAGKVALPDAKPGNGAMSKNIFGILFALIFAFVF